MDKYTVYVIYLGQTVSANTIYDKEIKRRIGIGWSAFGRHGDIMNGKQPTTLFEVKYSTGVSFQYKHTVRTLGIAKRTGWGKTKKTEKHTKRNREQNSRNHIEKIDASNLEN